MKGPQVMKKFKKKAILPAKVCHGHKKYISASLIVAGPLLVNVYRWVTCGPNSDSLSMASDEY